MRILIFLTISLFSSITVAEWSSPALVTKHNQNNFKINVSSTIHANDLTCTVKLPAIEYPHKQAWLIVMASPVEINNIEFRDFIWGLVEEPNDLILKTKLNIIETQPKVKIVKAETYYEVVLTKELAKTAYIYIDFPSVTFDGGYYYSIDLSSYCGG